MTVTQMQSALLEAQALVNNVRHALSGQDVPILVDQAHNVMTEIDSLWEAVGDTLAVKV